ncbi:disulfide bond formation protein DsbA [Lutimaribacter sp. EGI FJ00015]|uniref:Disulfide bond formation protein DsbA n=1 Tax=Lutimaribacter degradans TaxID=2945989 RepID=A0ACC5ZSP2_9RHOB|nr:disulfide bond formation protein DsbA [Lutimaribacter sp. EGI FJ00013]MCM2561165.1 disulfide bond formation protein DsbA [Lutimaribacter sp. EGI FJ00013]MCO0611886.1 disulfide bond formation protein DsbA [Lutimaribacter sp. EGI FJ00015]MCO0634993.1 disulfide bond formation protein DsbA [Lutimaribacter sp. EGI FJ00014]
MRKTIALACVLWGAGAPLLAETDLTLLDPAERAAFGAEIRALLLQDPEIVARALAGPSIYADAIENDLSRIRAHADTLFADGAALAIVTGPDCPSCAQALDELRVLTTELNVTFTELNLTDNRALADDLQLDSVPSYVLPDKMVRGHVPPVVLRRYLGAD